MKVVSLNNLTISEFELLFKKNYNQLCNVAFRIVNDKDIAEDLVQDVFLKVWENKESINFASNPGGYFYKMVSNSCLNYISRKKVLKFSDSDKQNISNIATNDSTESNLDFKKFQKTIYSALNALPPKCKAIFILSRFEDMKYREIAEQLEISIKTVEAQMGIAISRLNNDLKPVLMKNFPDIMFTLIILKYFLEILG